MYRNAMNRLIEWKDEDGRKPLIFSGVRQVGKTWLMNEFASSHFKSKIYVNFEEEEAAQNMFETGFIVDDILEWLQINKDVDIIPGETLIIFDEVQAFPKSLTALKYFCETRPDLHIIAAGSLLGVSFHQGVSFPVGKVQFLNMHPLSFDEFLRALGQERLADTLINKPLDSPLIKSVSDKLIALLKKYYYIGGMPAAVKTYIETKSFEKTREVQKELLAAYVNDFSKYASFETTNKLKLVWSNLLPQLAKENRKFVFGALKNGARAKDFELAINWLSDAGLIHLTKRVTAPRVPLEGYSDFNAYKIFFHDIGLLNAIGDLDVKTITQGNSVFTEFKGAAAEQFVLSELVSALGSELYYWANDNYQGEVDFLAGIDGLVIPVEVKAEENLNAKSLKSYSTKFSPAVSIRTSLSSFRNEGWLINLPLYMVSQIKRAVAIARPPQ